MILHSQASEHVDADFVDLQCSEFLPSGIDPRYIRFKEAKLAIEGRDPLYAKSEQLDPGEFLENLKKEVSMMTPRMPPLIIGVIPLFRVNDNNIK